MAHNTMKQVISLVLRVLVSAGVLWFLFSRTQADAAVVLGSLKGVKWGLLVLAATGFPLILVLGSLRWWWLLRSQGVEMGYGRVVQLTLVGLFFNNLAPGIVGGDLVRGYYASRGVSTSAAATAVAADRGVGLAVLVLMGLCASAFVVEGRMVTGAVALAGCGGAVVGLGTLAWFARGPSEWLRTHAGHLMDALGRYRRDWHVIAKAAAISVPIQATVIMINVCVAQALGIDGVGLARFIVVVPVIAVVTTLPISLGGLGVGEATYQALLGGLAGVAAGPAVALSLTIRVMTILWSLAGVPAYLGVRARVAMSSDDPGEGVEHVSGQEGCQDDGKAGA